MRCAPTALHAPPARPPARPPAPPPPAGKPLANPRATGDPYRTLFVGRLAYETGERRLRREFEEFGPVASVTVVAERPPAGAGAGSGAGSGAMSRG